MSLTGQEPASAQTRVEIVAAGIPRSRQSKDARGRARWMGAVTAAATAAVPDEWIPAAIDLMVQVVYYHPGQTDIDIDNMLKPILDALVGPVLSDDRWVSDVYAARRSFDLELEIESASPMLAEMIQAKRDFVHIVTAPAPDHGELLR